MLDKDKSLDTDEKKLARKRSLALCIYFATYFRMDYNTDCKYLYEVANNAEKGHIIAFWEKKKNHLDHEVVEYGEVYDVFHDFGTYKKVCQQSGESNTDKLHLLIAFKQIFSVPWLLCSEQLLSVTEKGRVAA